jgi:hypothetical protein
MLTIVPSAEDDLSSEDPEVGLRAVAALRRLAEAIEPLHVARARDLGWSWQRIAIHLQVSKQAVHQKYAATLAREEQERGTE